MSEFNKIYVNCVEDDTLKGQYGFFADAIDNLKHIVINDNLRYWGMLSHSKSCNGDFPFVKQENNEKYRFFYHDPTFSDKRQLVRIVTYRELAKWLAQGNGECCYFKEHEGPTSSCFNELLYEDSESNIAVHGILVRKWDTDEWSVPIADYLGLENNK
jgi:hypothetical protein